MWTSGDVRIEGKLEMQLREKDADAVREERKESGIQFPSSVPSFLFLLQLCSTASPATTTAIAGKKKLANASGDVMRGMRERKEGEKERSAASKTCFRSRENERATRAKMKLKENFILIPSSLSFHFRLLRSGTWSFSLLRDARPLTRGVFPLLIRKAACMWSPGKRVSRFYSRDQDAGCTAVPFLPNNRTRDKETATAAECCFPPAQLFLSWLFPLIQLLPCPIASCSLVSWCGSLSLWSLKIVKNIWPVSQISMQITFSLTSFESHVPQSLLPLLPLIIWSLSKNIFFASPLCVHFSSCSCLSFFWDQSCVPLSLKSWTLPAAYHSCSGLIEYRSNYSHAPGVQRRGRLSCVSVNRSIIRGEERERERENSTVW